jgi:hypothetical protein
MRPLVRCLPALLLLCAFGFGQNPGKPVHILISDINSHHIGSASANAQSTNTTTATSATATSGAGSGPCGAYGAYVSAGLNPQMPEVAKAFVTTCPGTVVVTTDPGKAEYLFIVNHERFEQIVMKHNKTVLVNRAGDIVWGDSTRRLDNAVKDACQYFDKTIAKN